MNQATKFEKAFALIQATTHHVEDQSSMPPQPRFPCGSRTRRITPTLQMRVFIPNNRFEHSDLFYTLRNSTPSNLTTITHNMVNTSTKTTSTSQTKYHTSTHPTELKSKTFGEVSHSPSTTQRLPFIWYLLYSISFTVCLSALTRLESALAEYCRSVLLSL